MRDIVNVFVFRRDLRTHDNLALTLLAKTYPNIKILPIFIFNPRQIYPEKNPYYSASCVEFMIESLGSLEIDTKDCLQYFLGEDHIVLNDILKKVHINAIAFNTDFTPFAKARDIALIEWCDSRHIHVLTANDYVLYDFKIKTEGGSPYEMFTPFYRKCIANLSKVPIPFNANNIKYYSNKLQGRIKNISRFIENEKHVSPTMRTIIGGRDNALDILASIGQRKFYHYDKERDYPALDKTTKLSSYLKFGCVSIRETFWEMVKSYGHGHGLVRELIWREFYANITYYYPRVLEGQLTKQNKPLKLKYNNIKWEQDLVLFKKWCDGRTGFPIVDAGMVCLKKTGFLHNRLRMIVASFLTKDLMIDWRLGERYFASVLVDADPSSNSGGWQFVASVGADAAPYFRIFNPWLQSAKFDNECIFIKKWLPVLSSVPKKSIHNWYTDYKKYPNIQYPMPIISHGDSTKKVIEYFSRV